MEKVKGSTNSKIKKTKELKNKHSKRIFLYLLFTFLLSLIPRRNVYFDRLDAGSEVKGATKEVIVNLPKPPLYPVNISNIPAPQLTAQGAIVVDVKSQAVLYEKNASERFFPASTTKIATALVSFNHYKLDDILTVKDLVSEGKTMGLVLGEKMTVENLLYGTLVHSANDAAYVLADNYPGGVEKFVDQTNRLAEEIGLEDTHFTNPVGFDTANHYTTAKDLSKMAKYALQNKTFSKIVGTKSITVSDVSYSRFHPLENVNELLGNLKGVSGVKTGFTKEGGEILVTEVVRGGREVLFVILKSQDRFDETKKMIEWVLSNFVWKDIAEIIPATPRIPQEDTQ